MAMTRRDFLCGIGALAGAGLAGCQAEHGLVVRELPDNEDLPVPLVRVAPGPPSKPPPGVNPIPAFAGETYGIYPRSAWTRSGPILSKIEPLGKVKLITFHHSGDQHNGKDVPFLSNGYNETVAHLDVVRSYHLSKGWADIGYHFAIDRVGRVWQLRSLNYQGAHVKGRDENNVGIVVLGNFNVQEPTDEQKAKILAFGRLVRTKYALEKKAVFTHQELRPTDCPGGTMQPYMVRVRKQGLV